MIRDPTIRRHFLFQHPLFSAGRTAFGTQWHNSIYFLWWEFLRRHEGYERTCQQEGKGRFAKLYEDFGDVHATDFRTWWTVGDRGARLFAEPPLPLDVRALTPDDLDQLQPNWSDKNLLLILVPLTLRKRLIEKRLAQLLHQHHKRKRGQRQLKDSQALYPIATQFNFNSLATALRIYDFRKEHPEAKLWEIAQKLRFTTTLTPEEIEKRGQAGATDKKNTMSVAVTRKLKMAEKLIEGVGRGVFPAR